MKASFTLANKITTYIDLELVWEVIKHHPVFLLFCSNGDGLNSTPLIGINQGDGIGGLSLKKEKGVFWVA